MTNFLWRWVFVLLGLFPLFANAQLSITSPVPRIVYQRNQYDEATILITGLAPAAATAIEARFVPMAIGQGEVTAWTPMDFLPSSTAFRGSVVVTKGQYRLDVRARAGTSILAEAHVNRVGVGEVFVIAGQSNVYGGLQRVPSSEEDRVSCVDFRQDSIREYQLPFWFSNVSYGSNIGPSNPPHLWSILGDRLVRKLNVPVLFLGAALGGTSSDEWKQSAMGNIGNTPNSAVYRRLGVALLHYVSRIGARAVLWHQGESDLTTSTQTYFNNIQYVINKSRQQTGYNQLAWVMSRTTYMAGQTNPNVIAAQNRLTAEVSNVFPGPATDSIIGTANRPDNVHLLGEGLYRFVNTWEQCLNTDFFTNSVPFTAFDESTVITSGYTLPLVHRTGDTIQVASLRTDAHEADNQYIAQLLRADNNATVYESAPSTANPIQIVLPTTLTDGQYRLRTLSTHPAITGTLSEPFWVKQTATRVSSQPSIPLTTSGGIAPDALQRIGYRYESGSHGFYVMVKATNAMEVRLQRVDGGSFPDTDWHPIPPSSEARDYTEFADFNYILNYPPTIPGVDGVQPGQYRVSVRQQGNSDSGIWFDVYFLDGRNILYYPMESINAVPPVLTADSLSFTPPCLTGSFSVSVSVADGAMNSGNTFTVQLSDPDGSFDTWTALGSSNTSTINATLPASLMASTNYRIRVVGSNPAVASAPSSALAVCADLSLAMRISSRVPTVGQIVSVTLSLMNTSTQNVDGVEAQSILPTGITFIDSPSPAVSVSSGTVRIAAGTIPSGATIPYVFRMKPMQEGAFATAAQITASQLTDPDSQPNSGTGDGQDDAATIDFRTPNGTGSLISSPNPNQAPLPPVRTKQPPTDPTKADLSLQAISNSLVVAQSGSVSLSLTVSNQGGLAASNVVVQALLPTGWQITNTSGLTLNGQLVSATLTAIPVGGSASLQLPIQINAGGTLKAQIQSANQGDPDSTPGNGYEKGEDDEATLSLRTRN